VIDAAVRRGLAHLASLQRSSGAIVAHDDTLFDVWETLAACGALLELGGDSLRAVVDRGLGHVATAERAGGRVLHTSEPGEGWCLETTAEYARLLAATGSPRASVLLESLRDEQLPFGCWAIRSPAIPADLQLFPSVTAFALLALRSGRVRPADLAGARLFLRTTQIPGGHWGAPWQYYGTPYYAMAPILEALRDDPDADGVRQRARAFLEASQRPDGSWFTSGGPSPELQTALGTIAALAAGVADGRVQRAGAFLRRSQRSTGDWNGGTFPLPMSAGRVQREDVYATAQALRALSASASAAPRTRSP
jgi:hypothetical protein